MQIIRYVTEGSFDAYMYQTLETKARFIQQVISGGTSVREAEDLENGALSFAEIKAIASGNPAVMEKIRIDTEVRKLDMLRAAHINQQYDIGKKVQQLPGQIAYSKDYHAGLLTDIATREAHETEEFTMTIDGRQFSGKHAREEAGEALVKLIMASLWGDNSELKHLGYFKGFELVSNFSGREGDRPRLYVRGTHMYEANVNLENAFGTIQSLEYALRHLDRYAEEEQTEFERKEKALAEYREQLHRPFEHEDKLRELLLQQQEINKRLDLDKGETQVVAEAQEEENVKGNEHLNGRRTARELTESSGQGKNTNEQVDEVLYSRSLTG